MRRIAHPLKSHWYGRYFRIRSNTDPNTTVHFSRQCLRDRRLDIDDLKYRNTHFQKSDHSHSVAKIRLKCMRIDSTNTKSITVGLIDADLIGGGTRHPNLAQMKISSYCKSRGCKVKLLYKTEDLSSLGSFDAIIISKVFTFTNLPLVLCDEINGRELELNRDIVEVLESCSTTHETQYAIGGTGFFVNGGRGLNNEIEHIMPDYSLYLDYVNAQINAGRKRSYYADYLDYSIGFTSRGCFRACEFCVNKYGEKKSRKHSPVSEFYDPNRKRIYLWDDNFFACKDWELILDELDATGRPFQFRQGLDVRLLTEKKAERLSKCKYHGDVIFAFDHIDDYQRISDKLKLWSKYNKRETKIYLICAFDSFTYTSPDNITRLDSPYLIKMAELPDNKAREQMDIEYLFERIRVCIHYNCLPYIMRYETYKKSEYRGLYIQIARWCNQPSIFKKMSFKEFCYANQKYSKKGLECSSMKAYKQFVNDRPDLAEKYFDMKYGFKETIKNGVWNLNE